MSNYFKNLRQSYIAEALYVFGYVNRAHLVRKFGISEQQASLDFRAYRETFPDVMRYDVRLKAWLAVDHPENLIRLISDSPIMIHPGNHNGADQGLIKSARGTKFIKTKK